MATYCELDPTLAAAAIEGYSNELAGEVVKLEAFYRQFHCPSCRGEMQKELHPQHAFADPDSLVPRSLLRCVACHLLLDPHSGLILERGKPATGSVSG